MKDIVNFGSDDTTRYFIGFFNDQLSLLEKLYQYQFTNLKHLDSTRIGNIYLLLFSIWNTGKSIDLLVRYKHVNESYILGRSFLERLITYTYLIFCDEEEYLRYLAYTKQKQYRVLNRKFVAGDSEAILKWSGSIDLKKYPDLKQAVDIFTSEKGKPKTRWTSQTLSKMLQSIASKGAIEISYLMLAILWIYDDASEALHGTLYGSIFHIGLFQGRIPSSKEELNQELNKRFSALLLSLGTCMHTLIQSFNHVEEIKTILSESTDNLKAISLVLKQLHQDTGEE